MKDTDLNRFGELSGAAQIAVAGLVNAMASLGLNDDWADVEHWDELAAFVDDAANGVRTYGRNRPAPYRVPLPVLQARARRLMEG